MGEKPMGTTPYEDEELDPMAGAAGINTTRSNIKSAGGVVGPAETEGGDAGIAIKEQGIR